ncbi:hypothetical protein ACKQTC_07710 [Peptococcus simiae]|uniref:Uncharacterized protein n=1 Tax=Peptococcus simiae TaxID=1643805 RepID=A0ABW9H068_9FIRM
MKKRILGLALAAGAIGGLGMAKRDLVEAIVKLERPQAELFTKYEGAGAYAYIMKNQSKSEDLFLDWIDYKGWKKADQVGEGYFFINDDQETLILNREAFLGGRYLVFRASRPVDA